MALILNKLTDREVQSIRKPGRHGDGGGLYLRVDPGGAKSWVFRFRDRLTGTQRYRGLGPLHAVPLAEARRKAAECRAQLADNSNPIEVQRERVRERAAQRAAVRSFAWCLSEYIEAHRAGWKSKKHAAQWSSVFHNHAPALLDKDVATITQSDVLAVLQPIWHEINETAVRIKGRISKVLAWAQIAGYRPVGPNPAEWRGGLEILLPTPAMVKPIQHFKAVPYKDAPRCYQMLLKKDTNAARALRMTILSAVRVGEVVGARWEEFDFRRGTWLIPAHRMKGPRSQRQDHEVPLHPELALLVKSLPRLHPEYVFPGGGTKNPVMSTDAVLNLLQALDPEWAEVTTHGWRSTLTDWAGDETDHDEAVTDQSLAHRPKGKVRRAYRRSTALRKRAALLTDWAAYLVTPVKRARRRG